MIKKTQKIKNNNKINHLNFNKMMINFRIIKMIQKIKIKNMKRKKSKNKKYHIIQDPIYLKKENNLFQKKNIKKE